MKFDLTLYIGHNVDGKPRHTTQAITNAVVKQLGIEGYTAYDAWGEWRGEKETSTIIKICGLDANELEEMHEKRIPALCYYLEQECILTEAVASNATMIWPCSAEEFANANCA